CQSLRVRGRLRARASSVSLTFPHGRPVVPSLRRPCMLSGMRSTEIIALEAVALELPLARPFVIATGRQPSARNVLVRVRLADGTTGLGESAPVPHISGETGEGTLAAIERARELVVGHDCRSWRALAVALMQVEPDAA